MSPKKRLKRILPHIRRNSTGKAKKPGSAPGTIQHIGRRQVEDIKITVYDFDEHHADEIHIDNIEECKPYLDSPSKTWVNVCGLHDVEKLTSVWSYFDLHPLIREDIVHTSQRPKMEHYSNNIFFVLRMLHYAGEEQGLEAEQVSIVLGKNYVLSFQESDKPYFEPVIKRLKVDQSRMRKLGPDYLTYALIDVIVDYYFKVLEVLEEYMEDTENKLMQNPDNNTLRQVHVLRREIVFFRKTVWPLRDTINSTIRDESPFIDETTNIYLRDVYDHVVQIIDNIENYRDMIMSMHDTYMSHISNKMNEIMKVLTIIATIFIPLTFIAGIYGMNFDPEASPYNMPELKWYWGYPTIVLLMLILAICMVIYFKKREWL